MRTSNRKQSASDHAGAARSPPWALALIFFGLSKPIQTPATRSAV